MLLVGCYEGIPDRDGLDGGIGGLDGGGDGDGDGDGSGGDDGGSGGGSGDAGGDGDGDGDGDGGDGDSGASGGDGDGDGDGGEPPPVDPDDGVWARDISLTEVSINQAVEVAVASGGNTLAPGVRNARIVQGRDALVRAQWQTGPGFAARTLEGRLVLVPPGGGTPRIYSHELQVSGGPNPASYGGTFRWAVDGADLQPGTRYSVALYELEGANPGSPAPTTPPRIPATGSDDLAVDPGNYELDIVLVPIQWTFNGQTRTTSLSSGDVETVRQEIYRKNPVSAVNISVRSQPVPFSGGRDLSGILSAVASARSSDSPANSAYYEGVVDFGCFAINGGQCSNNGGTTGLGYVTPADPWAANQRASISVWYNPASSARTINHELGHNQGLNHVGCGGAGSADPSYPYTGGRIGVLGHPLGTTEILSASQSYDYMSYCNPDWVSDWTFEKTAVRAGLLTADFLTPQGWVLQGTIGRDGGEHWALVRGHVPAELRDPSVGLQLWRGEQLYAEASAYRAELSDDGGHVIVVEVPDDLAALQQVDRVELLEGDGRSLVAVDLSQLAGDASRSLAK